MSDRIAVVNQGRIEQIGDASEIYHAPRTAFVANFIGQANTLRGEVTVAASQTRSLRLAPEVEVPLPAEIDLTPGSELWISLRPERVHVEKTRLECGGSFQAEVQDEVFKGAVQELSLRTESGLEFCALLTNRVTDAFRKGERVWCAFPSAESCPLFVKHSGELVAFENSATAPS